MEYIIKHKLLNSYLTNEKTGNWIKPTRKIDEAEKLKSIEEANQFLKKNEIKFKRLCYFRN